MPIYVYICQECGESFEENLPVLGRDMPVEAGYCPICKEEDCRIIRSVGNSGGFRLKGSGWERDGYASYLGDTPDFKNRR